MSTQTTTDISEKLAKIVAKSGKTPAEVQASYTQHLASLTSVKETDRPKYALKLVNRDMSINVMSPAIAFEGIIVGSGETRDLMKTMRQTAIDAYRANRDQAIASGAVKEEGDKIIILDNRAEINGQPNKNFGKPRPEHAYLRDVILAVRKPGEPNWLPGKLLLRGDQANLTVPLGKKVAFKALGEIVNGEYKLRSSVLTQFQADDSFDNDAVMNIIDTAFKPRYVKLGACFDYHKSVENTPGFWDRYVVTEGSISYIKFPDDDTKNIFMILNDDSLPTKDGVTCWIPNKLKSTITFGQGSIVTVIAQTSKGKGYDREKRVQTDEDVLNLNVYALFGRPGLTNSVEPQSDLI